MKTRPYQEQAIVEVDALLGISEGHMALVSPTGSGKSLMIAEIAKRYTGGTVVILVTITELIHQISEHLSVLNVKHSILKAGMESKFDHSCKVQLMMAQTYHARISSIDIKASLIIKDEIHIEWIKSKRMSEIHKALGSPRIIGLSATPYDSKGYELEGVEDYIKTTSMEDLTNQGFLSKVKYFVPKFAEEVDYSSLSRSSGDYSEKDIDSIVMKDDFMKSSIDAMVSQGIHTKKTIVFANSIAHSEEIENRLIEEGIVARAFHSKISDQDNDKNLKSFKSGEKIETESNSISIIEPDKTKPSEVVTTLVTVNKASTGFDVKDIELGVSTRKTAVLSLFVQQVGRVARIADGKTHAEWLDLASNLSEHGFPEDDWSPVPIGDRINLSEMKKDRELIEVKLISKENPTEITREKVLLKTEEILRLKQIAISVQTGAQLSINFNTTSSIGYAIKIGMEIDKRKNGKEYNKSTHDWIMEEVKRFQDDFPEYGSRIITTFKTRIKNIVRDGKKMAGLRYFPDWLREQTPYSIKIDYSTNEEYDDDLDIPF